MTSPCGKIRIPLNESQDEHSQIEEFLKDYKGEGIQHVALGTDDIYRSVETMRRRRRAASRTPSTPISTGSTPASPATARMSSGCRPTRS